jgi:preprotein translocase subunit SecA
MKEAAVGADMTRELERVITLKIVDEKWMDHLDAMDQLRQGIGLRAYGQKDPLIEYKFENDGKMQLEALDIGSFKGTYSIKDGKITIEYNILVKKVKDTYNLKLEGNKMYLDNEVFTRIT